MENTEKVFFEDNDPHWYVALGERWAGPLTASEVYEKVLSQEITWSHFVWRPGQPGWTKICDTLTFHAAVPRLPGVAFDQATSQLVAPAPQAKAAPAPQKTAPAPAPKAPVAQVDLPDEPPLEVRNWYLYYNDSQFGPFSRDEVERFLRSGRIHGRVHAWEGGMDNWERLERVPAFSAVIAELPKATQPPAPKAPANATRSDLPKAPAPAAESKTVRADQRSSPRRPLVAKILLADSTTVATAVCRDISVGGMQVLTDSVPGAVGAKIRLNVSTSGGAALSPFVAHGVIVRFLEDRRGFSFRFDKLSPEAQSAIENYINSAPDA